MYTVLDIIHAANSISERVTVEAGLDHLDELSPAERAESISAKSRVLRIIRSTIEDVERSLVQSSQTDDTSTDELEPLLTKDTASDSSVAMDIVAADVAPAKPESELVNGMSDNASGLGGQVESMQKMAVAIGPIVDTFNAILCQPYLKNYDARINSVPVVGLKGDNVMYIETKCVGTGVKDVWSIFASLPKDVNINSSNAVHFFPYRGDFCMSIGTGIWRKKHRSNADPIIKQAIDNWPKLYLDDWEQIGDKCLPDANLKSIVPFAMLSATGNEINFYLLTLKEDGSINILNGDDLTAKNIFTTLKNISKDPEAQSLKMDKIAYWNGKIVGYKNTVATGTSKGHTWNVSVNFDNNTFDAKDKFEIELITELTATDIGPVGVQKDGFLYKRIVETVKDPSTKASKDQINWTKWIKQDGVSHLGVASPGVMLDLETLTRSLRDRYLSTQTALYPVVNKINTFAITHDVYLQQLSETAATYAASETEAKQKQALKAAKGFVTHAKVWASIIKTQTEHSKKSVNLMTSDFSFVRTQLNQQLTTLRDKLVILEAQFKALEQAKSNIDKAFWVSLGVALLGLGLMILALCTGVGAGFAIAAGGLFIGGLVAVAVLAKNSFEITGQMGKVSADIREIKTAVQNLEFVVNNFKQLDEMYGMLNKFWGKMFDSAVNLQGMDDATAMQIGAGILEDQSSIDASILVTKKINKACETYLAVLNKAGIMLPIEDSDEEDSSADIKQDMAASDVAVGVDSGDIVVDPTFNSVQAYNSQVKKAQDALQNGRFREYEEHLVAADLSDAFVIASIFLGMPAGPMIGFGQLPFRDVASDLTDGSQVNGKANSHVNGNVNGQTNGYVNGNAEPAADLIGDIAKSIFTTAINTAGWLNKSVLKNNMSFLSTAMPYQPDRPYSRALNGLLIDARREVSEMLTKTLTVSTTAEDWVRAIPDFPVTEEEISAAVEYQIRASKLCQEGMINSRLANNAFVEFNRRATEVHQDLQRQIVTLSDRTVSVQVSMEEAIRTWKPDFFQTMSLISMIAIRPNAIAEMAMSQPHISSMQNEIRQLQREREDCIQDRESGITYLSNTQTWLEMCQKTSEILGSIYNTTTAIRYEVKYALASDREAYKSLAATQWTKIRQEVQNVYSLMGNSQPQRDMDGALMDINATGSPQRAAQSLMKVVSPAPQLLKEVLAQAENSKAVWADVNKLRELTFTDDIVVYWDPKGTNKTTLLDVIDNIRLTYIQMASTQYDAIQRLQTLALLQGMRANNVISGRISAHIFLKHTFTAIKSTKACAEVTKNSFSHISFELKQKTDLTKRNVAELKDALANANLDLGRRDKAYHDKVTGIIVKGCLTGFATGALVAAAVGAAYVGAPLASIPSVISAGSILFGSTGGDKEVKKPNGEEEEVEEESPEEEIDEDEAQVEDEVKADMGASLKKSMVKSGKTEKPNVSRAVSKTDKPRDSKTDPKKKAEDVKKRVQAAKTTWNELSVYVRSAKDTVSATTIGKALFNKLSLSEFAMLLALVKTAIIIMERTIAAVEAIQTPLGNLVRSLGGLSDILNDMDVGCAQYARDMDPVAAIQFGAEDADVVAAKWQEAADGCEAWLDVFNAQCISPISSSVM